LLLRGYVTEFVTAKAASVSGTVLIWFQGRILISGATLNRHRNRTFRTAYLGRRTYTYFLSWTRGRAKSGKFNVVMKSTDLSRPSP